MATKRNPTTGTPAERFWRKVDRRGPGFCWEWTTQLKERYPSFRVGPEIVVHVHRFSYELHHGPVPDGMNVLHACDNTRCVNPEHLWVGTDADNLADCREKGRRPPWIHADRTKKLDPESVRMIRSMACDTTKIELSRIFGVRPETIRNAILRRTWRNVT